MLEVNLNQSTLFLYNGISADDSAAAAIILAARARARAADARQADSQASAKRLARERNRKIQQIQGQVRHEQARLMMAKAAEYANDQQREMAVRHAHAGMLAAHMALQLVLDPPANSQSVACFDASV
jgi:hypothetical protein